MPEDGKVNWESEIVSNSHIGHNDDTAHDITNSQMEEEAALKISEEKYCLLFDG
jgi:hypothetical protein